MEHIQVSRDGHILVIKLNRPDTFNALSPDMFHSLGRALAVLNGDPQLRVAVLHAEGKHFTSGVELDLWAPILGSGVPFSVQPDEIDPYGLTGERHKKPLIIAVQGYCFTWGVEILLNSEIVSPPGTPSSRYWKCSAVYIPVQAPLCVCTGKSAGATRIE